MATIINADTSDGLKLTSDTSGQIDLQSAGSTKATVSSAGLASTVGGDVSMSSAAAGQLKVNGSGYSFAVALDASAAHLYHNSGARDLVLGINETEQMRLTTAGDLKFNSGFGSVGTAYGCRAWVNFDGTGTVSINGSGNVSSITDNGTGQYTVNFATNMPDDNYSVSGTAQDTLSGSSSHSPSVTIQDATSSITTSTLTINVITGSGASYIDSPMTNVQIIR